MEERPCRDFIYFKSVMEKENMEIKSEMRELILLMREQLETIGNQDKRIALLEQQNKLIFWIGAVITSAFVVALVGMFIKVMENTAIIS